MISPLVLLLLQTPKTYEELEIAKINAFHDLKRAHIETEAVIQGGQDAGVVRESLFVDGKRSHLVWVMPNGSKTEQIDDGANRWFVMHASKAFIAQKDADDPPFEAKRNLLDVPEHSFKLNLSGAGQMQFASNPAPTLTGVETVHEGDETLIKAVVSATGKTGHLTLTQWFLPDRWILKRFEMLEQDPNGSLHVTGHTATVDFQPTFSEKEFALDPAKVAGYERSNPPYLNPRYDRARSEP